MYNIQKQLPPLPRVKDLALAQDDRRQTRERSSSLSSDDDVEMRDAPARSSAAPARAATPPRCRNASPVRYTAEDSPVRRNSTSPPPGFRFTKLQRK